MEYGGRSANHYWLIVRDGIGSPEILSIGLAAKEYVPVFSFAEEARLFLELGSFGGGWRIRETGSGELLRMLFGDLSGIGRVALDPLPEATVGTAATLFMLGRKDFMDRLVSHLRSQDYKPPTTKSLTLD